MANPIVSVIMPVHGAQPFINEAIESVLGQTFTDFELIIVSEPDTEPEALKKIEGYRNPRIIHQMNLEQIGLERSLNLALDMARGEYIARLDSDDKSVRTRLEKQCHYLGEHADVAILGSSVYFIDEKSQVKGEYNVPIDPAIVGWMMLYNTAIVNPSSIMKRIVVQRIGGYDPDFKTAEDYDYWARASELFRIGNLPEKLVFYRNNPASISHIFLEKQRATAARISHRSMEAILGKKLSIEMARTMRLMSNCFEGSQSKDYELAAQTTIEMCQMYIKRRTLSPKEGKSVFEVASRNYWNLVARGAGADLGNSWKLLGRVLLDKPPRLNLDGLKGAGIGLKMELKKSRKKHKW